jgi:acyl-CoA synthetase (NDP forming)
MPEPSAVLRERLRQFLPAHCALRNPIDLTVEGTEAGYRETLLAVLDEFDAALALDVSTPYMDTVALARGVCDAAERSGKPVVANFMAGRIVADAIAYLKERSCPNYPTGERAVAMLARMADYENYRARRRPLADVRGEEKALPCEGRMLEPDAMAWLGDNGIPTLPFRFGADVESALRGCREIGYPVAMKVVSPGILHKSEHGGVALDIRDDAAASASFQAMQRAAAGKDFRGVVIYPMVRDAQEVLMGITVDPQFGPIVAFGLGGIYTEVLHDISLRVAPVDPSEAETMIREIRSFPILQGARGRAPRDLAGLAEALARFSELPFLYPEIAEIDLNPVFLFSEGLAAGDVRVISRSNRKGEET